MDCPLPINKFEKVTLAHGGGGKLTGDLVENLFRKELSNRFLDKMHDGAILPANGKIAFSTDSFVVDPLFFPGGDIGKLSVCGTINDVACCGARPLYLSLGMIIEEGLLMTDLERIVKTIAKTARECGVMVVTGDTKVVEKGKGDSLFISTSGIGEIYKGIDISPKHCRPGDKIILTGTIGDHGMAIMSAREGLDFISKVESDCAPIHRMVETVISTCSSVRVFRDPTRGGIASALNEISHSAGFGITIDESLIPVNENVRSLCEVLGFDPLYVANEGKLLVIVPGDEADRVVNELKKVQRADRSVIIGEVTGSRPGVTLRTVLGTSRIVDMISGEQLPRIC